MTTAVWKFPVKIDDIIEIEMPVGAEVLHFDVQPDGFRGQPCIWARVDPEAPKEVRKFRFAGTGHGLEDEVGKHVGSCQMMEGRLVWHLFELN